jgi:citrate lyase subunit beta/citryl-CoA lyase
MCSRVGGLAPAIDGVTVSVDDVELIRADTERSIRFGFGGKLCIHPKQISIVHEILAPSADQISWANKVIDAMEISGGAAVQLDGKMVDLPVLLQARRLLSRVH